MARGNQTPFYLGLSALFYLILLFSPLALLQTANAQSDQEPLQENYGTGRPSLSPFRSSSSSSLCNC
jgi:endoplasmic reticulum chaperone BiP